MRTIKFRGKCIDNYLWEYGWLYCKNGRYYIKDGVNDTVKLFLVNQDTIGQFTGLSDRNGKEIYEGDIVQGLEYADFYTGIDGEVNAVVTWDGNSASFVFDAECKYYCALSVCKAVTVIGNIHDNPELVKIDDNELGLKLS